MKTISELTKSFAMLKERHWFIKDFTTSLAISTLAGGLSKYIVLD